MTQQEPKLRTRVSKTRSDLLGDTSSVGVQDGVGGVRNEDVIGRVEPRVPLVEGL